MSEPKLVFLDDFGFFICIKLLNLKYDRSISLVNLFIAKMPVVDNVKAFI